MKINYGAFCFLPHNNGNKPPSRHEAKSLKRRVDYTGQVLFLTRYIHALFCLAPEISHVSPSRDHYARDKRKIRQNHVPGTYKYGIRITLPPECQLVPDTPDKEDNPGTQNDVFHYAEQDFI